MWASIQLRLGVAELVSMRKGMERPQWGSIWLENLGFLSDTGYSSRSDIQLSNSVREVIRAQILVSTGHRVR